MTIEQQIYQNSVQNPERVALISGEQQVTYAQMWERCLLAATNLRKKYSLKAIKCVIFFFWSNMS